MLPAPSTRDLPLDELHPETSRLIPTRKKRHHVRVQGRLALVRSVSTADLGSASAPPRDSRFESAVGSVVTPRRSRRHSLEGQRHANHSGSDSETEDDEKETVLRDRQLRGYGIGGFGNIRRPTEVVDFSSGRLGSMTLFSSVGSSGKSERRRWNLMSFLGKKGDRKGKGAASP